MTHLQVLYFSRVRFYGVRFLFCCVAIQIQTMQQSLACGIHHSLADMEGLENVNFDQLLRFLSKSFAGDWVQTVPGYLRD